MRFVKNLLNQSGLLWAVALSALPFCGALQAQVVPSATWPGHALWVEGNISNFHAGFPYGSNERIWGWGVSADYHLNGRIDAEAETHFIRYSGFHSTKEDSYLIGPRYLLKSVGNIQPNVQCVVGIAKMQYPFQIGKQNYFVIGPGAGVSYRITRGWSLRAEYEYQAWQGSPNFVNEPARTISPSGLNVGVAYQLLRVGRGRH